MKVLTTIISTLLNKSEVIGMDKLYCGIDIHKETFVGCIMDMNGTVIREHGFMANKDALERFISGIPNSKIKIAIEACGIWRGAYKTLSELWI